MSEIGRITTVDLVARAVVHLAHDRMRERNITLNTATEQVMREIVHIVRDLTEPGKAP